MHINPQRAEPESFVIQVGNISSCSTEEAIAFNQAPLQTSSSNYLNFSAMKLFHRFRKIIMRLIFSLPSHDGSSGNSSSKKRNCEKSFEPPKTSCSSYYSSHAHYNEAIADCIEFFNKSSQEEGILVDARYSDVTV
ncbi:F10A5.9 [Quillaja saponaria]|uniref:F10A5.9 n=1 Tax=Quillaja saponaria TaxID=32244 RepID=A0AAD7LGR3_QUISA|nr:F10A5.9 [Quillaja saponaria]